MMLITWFKSNRSKLLNISQNVSIKRFPLTELFILNTHKTIIKGYSLNDSDSVTVILLLL